MSDDRRMKKVRIDESLLEQIDWYDIFPKGMWTRQARVNYLIQLGLAALLINFEQECKERQPEEQKVDALKQLTRNEAAARLLRLANETKIPNSELARLVMGWTHYWQRESELPGEAFENAVKDFKLILTSIDIPLAGFEADSDPTLNHDGIIFNGIKEQGCEPFFFKKLEIPRQLGKPVFSYCKTEKLPYDLCVKCVLVILKHYLGDRIEVMSDGTDEDWKDAKQLCHSCLGYGSDFILSEQS